MDADCAKFRASKLQVDDIIHKFNQTITCDSMKVTFYLELETDSVRDGEWSCWHNNGQIESKGIYKDSPEGEYIFLV